MSKLKSLSFCALPAISKDPITTKRYRLIERLEQQRQLATDPSFTVRMTKIVKNADGTRTSTERQKRLTQWWKTDEKGAVVLSVRVGLKTLEFEKGKAGISVGPMDRLDSALSTLIEAVRAGELDGALLANVKSKQLKQGTTANAT